MEFTKIEYASLVMRIIKNFLGILRAFASIVIWDISEAKKKPSKDGFFKLNSSHHGSVNLTSIIF